MTGWCDGWSIVGHETDEPLTSVYLEGCKHCGGADCGDTGDVLDECPKCLIDLKAAMPADRYEIIPEEASVDGPEKAD